MGVPVAARLLRSVFSRRAVDGLLCNPTPAAGVFFYVIDSREEGPEQLAPVQDVLEHAREQLEHEYGMEWTPNRVQEVFARLVAGGWIWWSRGGASCSLSRAARELGWMTAGRGKPSPVEKLEPQEGSFLDMCDPQVQSMARELIGRALLGQQHLTGAEQSPIGGASIQLDSWGDDGDPGVTVHAWGTMRWLGQPAVWKAWLSELEPYGFDSITRKGKLDDRTYADVLAALVKRTADRSATWGEYERNVKHRKHTAVVRAVVKQVLESRAATSQGPAPLGVLYVATCMQFVDGDPTAPTDAAHVLEALGELVSGGVAIYSTIDSHHAWALKV